MDYFAFYWTLPVKWAGFTSLPSTPDEAAKVSKTIRYQVQRVRRWVKDEGGRLVKEVVFLDTQPDRGTAAVQQDIIKLIDQAHKANGEVVLVDFSEAYGWRRHGPLWDILNERGGFIPLPPEPIMLDGAEWEPTEHFRIWRQIDQTHHSLKPQAQQQLREAMLGLRADGASYAKVATELNSAGTTTVNGKPWTGDNVRKFLAQG